MGIEEYVSNHIFELLEKNKMTQYRLSQITGLAQSTIRYMVRGETMPTLINLEKICDAFGISLAEFLSEGKYKDLTTEQKQMLDIWSQLDAKDKRAMRITMESLSRKE